MNKKIALAAEAVCVVIIFLTTYAIVLRQMGYGDSDYNGHANLALSLRENGVAEMLRNCIYPLWHILVAMANGFFVIPIEHAAAVVTALLNVFTYGVVLGAFQKEMGERAALWIPFGAIVLCIMEGFCVPWYNKEIYRGQIGINIWHNPTNLCVRPFMLLAFLQMRSILADYGDNRKTSTGKWICVAVLMCVCNLAKPSCAQIIIPGGA